MKKGFNEFEYFAFISYKREDEKWAKWLQKKLESYSLPTAIRKENPELPNKIRPIFRDKSELSGGNLKAEIEKGLNGSKYLIVICSPRSAKSPWVSKEVQHFIDQGREEYIIPFIIGGIPNASKPEDECFPEGLRKLTDEKEILGININEMGRDAAAVKVIARMFDLRFDSLWQRYERIKRRRNIIYTCITLISIVVACIMIYLSNKAESQAKIAIENKERAERERNNTLALLAKQFISEDSYGASIMALDILKRDINNVEAEAVLRESYSINNITLRGHSFWVNSISFSNDSLFLASASEDNTMKIWNLNDGGCIKTVRFDSPVIGAYYLPNNNDILSITGNGGVYIYDSKNNRIKFSKRISSDITKTCISENGKRLVSTNQNGLINVIDIEDLKIIKVIEPKNEFSNDINIAIGSNGEILYYSVDNEIHKIDIPSNLSTTKSFEYVGSYITVIGLSSDGSHLMVGFGDQTKILDANLKEIKTLLNESPTSIKYVENNGVPYAITGHQDGFIKIWNILTYVPMQIFKVQGKNIAGFSNHPSNRYIAYFSTDSNGDIKIMDSAHLYGTTYYSIIMGYDTPDYIAAADMTVLDQTPYIALSNNDNLKFFKFSTNTHQFEPVRLDSTTRYNYTKIKFSPSGKYLLAADDNKIVVWDTKTGEYLKSFIANNDYIGSFSFININSDLLTTQSETDIKIWDIGGIGDNTKRIANITPLRAFDLKNIDLKFDFNESAIDNQYNLYIRNDDESSVYRINLITNEVSKLAFVTNSRYIGDISISPYNNYLALSDADMRITIFDLNENKTVNSWIAHSSLISKLIWHPNGKYLITSARDNRTKVWDVKSGVCVLDLPWEIEDVGFSNDGQVIYGTKNNHSFGVLPFPSLIYIMNIFNERFKNRVLTPNEKQLFHIQ